MIIIAFQFKERENTNPDHFDCFEVETSSKFSQKTLILDLMKEYKIMMNLIALHFVYI